MIAGCGSRTGEQMDSVTLLDSSATATATSTRLWRDYGHEMHPVDVPVPGNGTAPMIAAVFRGAEQRRRRISTAFDLTAQEAVVPSATVNTKREHRTKVRMRALDRAECSAASGSLRGGVAVARRLVFLVLDTCSEEASTGVFSAGAQYHLQAYLESCPELTSRLDVDVLRLVAPAGQQVTNFCRSHERFISLLLRDPPAVVGFSLYVWNMESSVTVARLIKELAPEITLVAGGPEVADRPDFVQQYPEFDVLVEGDGEVPLRQFLGRLLDGNGDLLRIPGTSIRTEKGFEHFPVDFTGEDLDSIPSVVARNPDLMGGTGRVLSSRGCSNACAYCLWCHQPQRKLGTARILSDLEHMYRGGVRHITFFDFDFAHVCSAEPESYETITRFFRERQEVSCSIFVNPKSADEPWLEKLVDDLRVGQIFVGVQTLSKRALQLVNRAWAVDGLSNLRAASPKVKRRMVAEMMYPLPGETMESFTDGLQALLDVGVQGFQIFPLLALRGTGLRHRAQKLGLVFTKNPPYAVVSTPTFTRDDWFDAAGLSYLLSHSTALLVQRDELWALRSAAFGKPKGQIQRLLEMVRTGAAVDQILRDLLDGPLERAGYRIVWRGNHPVEAERIPSGQSVDEQPVWKQEPLQDTSPMPPFGALQAACAMAGARLLKHAMDGNRLTLTATYGGGELVLIIDPTDAAPRSYAVVQHWAVSYQGQLRETSVVDRFVAALDSIL